MISIHEMGRGRGGTNQLELVILMCTVPLDFCCHLPLDPSNPVFLSRASTGSLELSLGGKKKKPQEGEWTHSDKSQVALARLQSAARSAAPSLLSYHKPKAKVKLWSWILLKQGREQGVPENLGPGLGTCLPKRKKKRNIAKLSYSQSCINSWHCGEKK